MKHIGENIVFVGGGTGVGATARYFKKDLRFNIATIHPVTDSGSHSGELRMKRGILPPGDIRQTMYELSDEKLDPEWRSLLRLRFSEKGSRIDKAAIGNLILAALTEKCSGDMTKAIRIISPHFGIRAKILPVSMDDSHLFAELSDGSILKGEAAIDTRNPRDAKKIVRVWINPQVVISPEVYEVLTQAHKIVFCPGDLYTSLIPNILISGFVDAVKKSKAQLIYVVNIMTKKAETHEFAASDFARTLLDYLQVPKFDAVICNNGQIDTKIRLKYRNEDYSLKVKCDSHNLDKYAKIVVTSKLVDETTGTIRHNSRTAEIIAHL